MSSDGAFTSNRKSKLARRLEYRVLSSCLSHNLLSVVIYFYSLTFIWAIATKIDGGIVSAHVCLAYKHEIITFVFRVQNGY